MNWTRCVVNGEAWQQTAERLRSGECSLLGLWGELGYAHMAVFEMKTGRCDMLSFACEANRFPSIGRLHPPAIRLERAMRDLTGLEAEGLPDTRPSLRHSPPYPFLPAEAQSLHQIPGTPG